MISNTSAKFWQLYDGLPIAGRRAAREAFRRFSKDPSHPGLHFHRLDGYPNVWSARVSISYRAVGLLKGDKIRWFWIGTHAQFDREFP